MLQQLHLVWFCLHICLEGVRICLQGICICIEGINSQDFCLSLYFEQCRELPDVRRTTPLRADDAFTQPPQFPDIGETAAVARTPRAGGLPSRWTVTAYRGGQVLAVVTGRDIVDHLAVGPDIDDALAGIRPHRNACRMGAIHE